MQVPYPHPKWKFTSMYKESSKNKVKENPDGAIPIERKFVTKPFLKILEYRGPGVDSLYLPFRPVLIVLVTFWALFQFWALLSTLLLFECNLSAFPYFRQQLGDFLCNYLGCPSYNSVFFFLFRHKSSSGLESACAKSQGAEFIVFSLNTEKSLSQTWNETKKQRSILKWI